MENSKRNTKILIAVIICIIAICVVIAIGKNDTKVYAMQSSLQQSNLHSINDIVSATEIEDNGYLYNYDGSIDYIYIDFAGSNGYIILLEETLEIVEYTTQGDFPYENIDGDKYYGGPNAYYVKNENNIQNILTDETFECTDDLFLSNAGKIRQVFSVQSKSIEENAELIVNKSNRLSTVFQQINSNIISPSAVNSVAKAVSAPPLDENNFISPTNGAQYIENSEYFLTTNESPRHGDNNGNSCTTVAIQLLLSFNNYYNDRRIIDDIYLFGDESNNPENNPNYCIDPNKITSETLGSKQSFHDMLLNSYNIIGSFNSSSEGLESYLEDRNIDADVNYTYTSALIGYLDKNIVLTELNAGRPIVLQTSSTLNGTPYVGQRTFDHAVIAYGYQSFAAYTNSGDTTIYDGYITHFGWDPNGSSKYINIWANKAWFNNAIRLKINHTHEYTTVDTIEDGCIKICKCYCGHREVVSTRRHIYNDFGYEGSTYSWKGLVEMRFTQGNKVNSDDVLIIENSSNLEIEVKTISSKNAFLVTNGQIKFELENNSGEILQTNICSVTVDLLNNVTLEGNLFTINTRQMNHGTYHIKITSTFSRGEWSSEDTTSYTFRINRPITVMEDFGYLSSWYKWKGYVTLSSDKLYSYAQSGTLKVNGSSDLNFKINTAIAFNAVKEMTGTITITLKDSAGNIEPINGNNTHTSTVRVGLASNVSITNSTFSISPGDLTADTYTLTLNCRMTRDGTTYTNSKTYTFEKEESTSLCVAEGSMITLADGSQKAVEDLTGEEMLLVWNMFTGEFDSAPIVFIDSDPESYYEVINLYFSDGTTVKVISEHAFWDINLNKYVYLRSDAAQYIGHWFNKQTIDENGNMVYTQVQLTNVVVQQEYTSAWSPVTYGHLCYYVNGMLSMPGATTGLINIFEVDPDTMTIDQEAYTEDVEEYGLFTYEEFNALCPIPEAVFNFVLFPKQYLTLLTDNISKYLWAKVLSLGKSWKI